MRNNSKGFSYIELILVLALAAILMAIAGLSINLISRTNVNKAADKLVSTFTQARMTAMAKGTSNGVVELTFQDDTVYYYSGSYSNPNKESERKELVTGKVTLFYKLSGNSTLTELTTQTLLLRFDQTTGSFLHCSGIQDCEEIVIKGSNTSSKLILYPLTGRCEIEQ